MQALDLEVTAEKHIHKQLVKTKRIRESPAFEALYAGKTKLEGPKSPADANINARLYKSQPVKEAMTGIMSGIYGCLGLEEYTTGGNRETLPSKQPTKSQAVSKPTVPVSTSTKALKKAPEAPLENIQRGTDSDEEDANLETYESRLAPSTTESDSDTNPNSNALPTKPPNTALPPTTYNPAADMSISPSPTPSPSSSPPPTKSKRTPKAAPKPKPTSTTTFLPSLTMGGYWSGSDSSGTDIDAADLGGQAAAPRKNRKGQQERRTIAEKKFGRNANHLKDGQQSVLLQRDQGWDAKRGATTSSRGGGRGRGGGGGFARGGRQRTTGANSDPVRTGGGGGVKQKEKEAPLHPSWEAAKKAKEAKPVSFQGKKVVFD